MSWGRKAAIPLLVAVTFVSWSLGVVQRGYDTAVHGVGNSLVTEALAQVSCVPNPNAAGPPFVNGCSVPASGLNVLANAVGIGLPQVATNTALKNLSTAFSFVMRLGFTVAGDSPVVPYNLSNSACSLNGGIGDGGLQVLAVGGGKCWLANFAGIQPTPQVWGAKGDGVTDDFAALTAAFGSGVSPVYLSSNTYFSSAQIPLTGGNKTIQGTSYNPNTFPPTGSVIQCNATIAVPCLLVGNNDNLPYTVKNLTISRGAGIIPTGGSCLSIQGAQQVIIDHVYCYNHQKGFEAHISGANGIYATFDHVGSCKISGSHVLFDSFPGISVENSIFGCNGAGASADVASNEFVRITGNWDNTQGTIKFINDHFNLGQNTANCAFNFNNFSGSTNIVKDIEIIGGHVETAQQGFCTDSTVAGIQYLAVNDVWFAGGWGGSNALFSLNAATKLFSSAWTGDSFTGWTTASLAPTGGFDDFKMSSSTFANTPLSITCQSATTNLVLEGNTYQGLSISGNCQGAGSRITGIARTGGGSYTYTQTGNLEIGITNESLVPCSIALTFTTPGTMTQTLNKCVWQLSGSMVDAVVNITVTAIGTASGNATLITLPQPANANALTMSNCYNTADAGITVDLNPGVTAGFFATPTSASIANLWTQTATGIASLTAANFPTNTNFSCSLRYPLGS